MTLRRNEGALELQGKLRGLDPRDRHVSDGLNIRIQSLRGCLSGGMLPNIADSQCREQPQSKAGKDANDPRRAMLV